eukprot:s1336_g10.t1
MLFFLIIQLCFIEHMYQYSLDSFVNFLYKAIDRTEATDDIQERTKRLIAVIRMTIFRWVNRGLFERHKLIFCSMLTFKLFQKGFLQEDFSPAYFNYLLRAPMSVGMENPLQDWLPTKNWGLVLKLNDLEGFENFAQNMEKDAPNRFKEWFNEIAPEEVKLPLDWKRLDSVPFQKLLVLRALRPDRCCAAMAEWIRGALPNGKDFMDCDGSSSFAVILSNSFEDSTSTTPIFFILSPGADPVKEVESMGKKRPEGLSLGSNYWNVAMGQGQDVVAMAKLDIGHREGHWVMLQNIHLMPKWCVELEKKLDVFAVENSHPNFRLFLSADPSKGRATARHACKPPTILRTLPQRGLRGQRCQGEGSSAVKIPWDDLRYIFGEIMYGGHIVDDWDRRMSQKYLLYFMRDELLDEIDMIPYAEGKLSWPSPQPAPHERYLEHIETMPPESPLFFGMHPNAEINFRTAECDKVFELLTMLAGGSGGGDGDDDSAMTPMQVAQMTCDEILEEVNEKRFPTDDVSRGMNEDDKGPYQFVFLQECEYMNALLYEMVKGLQELQLGFKGELTMSENMEAQPKEDMAKCLYSEKLPMWWVKLGFASTRPLKSWRVNLQERYQQLDDWINDPLNIPKASRVAGDHTEEGDKEQGTVVDISKLFNPQSYLTAIKQQIEGPCKDGAYVSGMYLEGARWDMTSNSLEDSKPKEMFTAMPVITCKAGMATDKADKNIYICPTYCVPTRRPYFVFAAQLRTKAPADKWVLAGVGMILDIGL